MADVNLQQNVDVDVGDGERGGDFRCICMVERIGLEMQECKPHYHNHRQA